MCICIYSADFVFIEENLIVFLHGLGGALRFRLFFSFLVWFFFFNFFSVVSHK